MYDDTMYDGDDDGLILIQANKTPRNQKRIKSNQKKNKTDKLSFVVDIHVKHSNHPTKDQIQSN